MKVADAGEFGLIAELRRMLEGEDEYLVRGIGDDTAVLRSRSGELWAYTADAVVEGVHFDTSYVSWHALGYRALAANLSDLASMGGCAPSFALVVLGLTGDMEMKWVGEIYRGIRECGEEFSCRVAGGDIVRSPHDLFISISLVGLLEGEGFLTRSGARPGQAILVTGTLGDSYLGLRWLMGGKDGENACAERHLYPRPRLQEGRLALRAGATAAIDISDGLLRDLGHICEESGVGAEVFLKDIPLSRKALETAELLGENASEAALFGGEDYELVLTVEEGKVPALLEEASLSVIGRITAQGGVTVLDSEGKRVDIKRIGYEHFKEG